MDIPQVAITLVYRQLAVEGARELAFLCVFIHRQLGHVIIFGIVCQERIVIQVRSRGDNGIRSAKASAFAFIFLPPLSGLLRNLLGHWHNSTDGIESGQEEVCLCARPSGAKLCDCQCGES